MKSVDGVIVLLASMAVAIFTVLVMKSVGVTERLTESTAAAYCRHRGYYDDVVRTEKSAYCITLEETLEEVPEFAR